MIPSLNYAVLIDVLNALKEGNIHHCESLGFTFEEMKILNQLSIDDLFAVSRSSTPFMAVMVDHNTLSQALARSQEERQRQQQLNRAITLGGSIALISHYFGLTSNEICNRRRLLGVAVPQGRTPIPDETTDADIWRR